MSELQGSPERETRSETGIFIYSHSALVETALKERRSLGFFEEPHFVVREYPMVHDKEGRRKLLHALHNLLEEDEAIVLNIEGARLVAGSNLPELTNSMLPGQIRRITAEEYMAALRNKYGDAIQGSMLL